MPNWKNASWYVCTGLPRRFAPLIARVMHHAIMNVLEPVFEKQFIFHTYACRKGKGKTERFLQIDLYIESKMKEIDEYNDICENIIEWDKLNLKFLETLKSVW